MTATFNPTGFHAVLMGDESLTIACADMILAGGHTVAAVVTRDDAVRDWADAQGINVLSAPRDLVGAGLAFDWLLSIANLRMIPDDVLALPAKGAINFHDGPLPRYAGLNTPAWAILNQEVAHGVTWHVIEGGVDEGDVLAQRAVDIAPGETAFSLNSKCYAAGMESFAAVLAQLEAGTLERSPQDLSQRSYFAKNDRPAAFLDFAQPVATLSALVRALDFGGYANPLTVAKVAVGDQVLAVGGLESVAGDGAPGTVLAVSGDTLTVAAADGAVRLTELRGLAGEAADLAVSAGELLTVPDMAAFDVRGEDHWRAKLRGTPVVHPLVRAGSGAVQSRALAADGLTQAERAAAVAAAVSDGPGMMALGAATAHPLAAEWLPLEIAEVETPVALAKDMGKQLDRAEGAAFARDLLVRDPEISVRAAPMLAVSDAGFVAGSAVTVSLSDMVLHWDEARLSEAAAGLIAARIEAALAAFPNAESLDALRVLPEAERALQIETWNATARAYTRETMHAGFEAQVARTPDAPALVFEDEVLSYAALNARANRLAHRLRASGAAPGVPVGLYAARTPDLVVGAMAILKAGGAYVPLDPAYPADRIAHYITDSAAPIIVSQTGLAGQLPDHGAQVICVDEAVEGLSEENPPPAAGPDDLAYLIYTSGSTGTPKGVMVSHGNAANFFAGMDDRIAHQEGDVWLAVTSLSFDISVLELFWTLARGFKVVLAGDESRTLVSNGPVGLSDQTMDFNLMYWGNDDGVGPKKYELLLEGAKFADAHGFNAVWTPERHFHAFGGPYPNPSVTGAAVAAVTQNLAVRAGSCVAPLHHPARITEEWAVIDNLTNGRVGLAIASGWQPDDFVLRPENTPPANKPAMYQVIEQLRDMWAGRPVAFPKGDGSLHEVITQPRPVSEKLPIWVTTAGNPQTWKEAGQIGANVLTHLLGQSIDEVAGKIEIYHAALREAGHDPADFTITLMLHSYLAETREEAERVARGPMKDYLRSAAALIKQYAWAFPAFKRPEGTANAFDLDLEGVSEEELDAILEFAFQRYFNDSGMFGTVADGVARVEALKRIGVTEVACLIDYGIAPETVLEGLKPLAEVLRLSNQAGAPAADDFSLAAQIVRHGVTHLQCTPSMAQMLVANDEARGALSRLKHVMVGGEALPGTLVKALQGATKASLQNMYGPTETTIWSTTQMVSDAEAVTTPVGTPIANTQIFILDEKMQPQRIGQEGQMWIGGDGVTQGYWQREAMTAERFVDNPFGAGKLYATGDLAAWDAEGCLHFGGRADAQVKIRGHRIELGEIEARLAEVPGVTQAVVSTADVGGTAALVGYITTSKPVSVEAAREALARDLPAIMVPSQIMTLDAMPLTPNKKIDRKALPAPKSRRAEAVAAAAPAEGAQGAIAAVWSGLLGVSDIRADDNFFALGGHSLLAVQAHRDIKTALSVPQLSITDIFRFPTLDALAKHIDGAGGAAEPAPTPEPVDSGEKISKRRAMRAGRRKAGA